MEKKEMLEMLIQHYSNGNDAEFARRLGLKAQALANWKKRGSLNAELIYSKCESVSADWLLSGKGEMLASEQKVDTQDVNNDLLLENETLREEIRNLKIQLKLLSDPKKSAKDGRVYRLWSKFMDITLEMQNLYKEEKEE